MKLRCIANKFQTVGKFASMESANNEGQLYTNAKTDIQLGETIVIKWEGFSHSGFVIKCEGFFHSGW